jgi:hypothetical protein
MVLCKDKGAVTLREALNSCSELKEGSMIPKPPSLAGSVINFLSMLFRGGHPVRVGRKSHLIISSSACRWQPISGIVRER